MLHFTCGGCGKSLQAKEEHAAKKTQCPKCQLLVLIPGDPIHITQVVEPVDTSTDLHQHLGEVIDESVTESLPTLQSETTVKQSSISSCREPWYYGLIGFVASGAVFLSIIGSIISIFLVLVLGIRALIETKDFVMVLASVYFGLLVLVWLIAFLFVWSFVLLALDMARNIRAIKHKMSS